MVDCKRIQEVDIDIDQVRGRWVRIRKIRTIFVTTLEEAAEELDDVRQAKVG